MQTNLSPSVSETPSGKEANRILRSCVHCGFCTATCPTYQLLGDELDGPRGRIYQIKEILEGSQPTRVHQKHLDRCLTCLACETTCPSGVEYGRLLDIGRHVVEQQVRRSLPERLLRTALKMILPYPERFGPLVALGKLARPLMPASLRAQLPISQKLIPRPGTTHPRKIILFEGCVQPSLAPEINRATAHVLDRLGIQSVTVEAEGCCGAVNHHLADEANGRAFAKRNIDAWIPLLDEGIEAIILTASGCGSMIREYGYLLRNDPAYAEKARRVSEHMQDLSEFLVTEELGAFVSSGRISVHVPCTLQHGQQLPDTVETILTRLGYRLNSIADSHLCCGSAGTYSILQSKLAKQLRTNKLTSLEKDGPDIIVTANIGCLTHLRSGTDTPVKHWIELLAQQTTT